MYLRRALIYAVSLTALSTTNASPQGTLGLERDTARTILQVVGDEVRKHYYDPQLHGLDWDAKLEEAKKKINSAKSYSEAISYVAAVLGALNDSHTLLLPPPYNDRQNLGWAYQMIGERCFVTQVQPGSDAEAKGIRPGDTLLAINGNKPTRANFTEIRYVFSVLRPRETWRLSLQGRDGNQRNVDVDTKVEVLDRRANLTVGSGRSDTWSLWRELENEGHLMRARYQELGGELMVLKLPQLSLTKNALDNLIGKARKHKALILDLRGNGGGGSETVSELISGMFSHDVKIDDRVGRKTTEPEIAKGSHDPFTGKLVVLVDSLSASASEVLARVMQIEKRGVVIGDRTAGEAMKTRRYDEKIGAQAAVYYSVFVTEANLIMSDGKSLEHVGVSPDQVLLPTPDDLANGRDPVLAHAAEIVGGKLSPEEAGKIFPYEWPPE
jgi:carboxyl-terminal processing protease